MTLPLFDPEPLVSYLGERDGVALVREIASIFADDMPRRLRGLRESAAANDDERTRHWGHSIKGGAAIAGARRLAAAAEAIERAASGEACAEARARLEEIASLFEGSRDALQRWVDAQGAERG